MQIQGQVSNVSSLNVQDSQSMVSLTQGKQGELLASEIHGKWYNANVRSAVFHGSATAMTTPAIANNLASLFALYNPTGSGVVAELICTDIFLVLATTVVNGVSWYAQSGFGAGITIPSLITTGTAQSGNLSGGSANNKVKFCTALTAVGTPSLLAPITTFGAVTSSGDNPIHVEHDGAIVLFPGSAIYLATSTAAWTASGMGAHVSWAEWLLPQ